MRRIVLALSLVVSAVASAQEQSPLPQRLYLDQGILLGSPRVLALGGAYTGIAEGASGMPSNLAALAQKSNDLDRNWDVGVGLSWLDLPIGSPRTRDLDNDGRQDAAQSSRQFLFALQLQYKRFGLGAYFRTSRQQYCGTFDCNPAETLTIDVSHTALAGAVSLGDDDFIAAIGLYAANATMSNPRDEWFYGDTGTSFDMLYRPKRYPWRIGVSVKPQVLGPWRPAQNQKPFIGTRQIFSAVVSPASLSIGASMKLGDGAKNYNRLSPAAYRFMLAHLEDGETPSPQVPPDAPDGDWLLTAQVDLIAPVDNAVNLLSFVTQEAPQPVGSNSYLVPRIGVENETFAHRLRLRLGSYIEPSVFKDVDARPHLTGGAELFVVHYYWDWSLSAAGDVAPRYYNLGLSIGFWD